MGKHHRKWFIDEPIASNKRAEEMMDDLEDWGGRRNEMENRDYYNREIDNREKTNREQSEGHEYVRNPDGTFAKGNTSPAGFDKHPENRHNGSWHKQDTPRYKIECLMKMSDDELEKVVKDKNRQSFERSYANIILLMRSATDIEEAAKASKALNEMIHEVYGKMPEMQITVEADDETKEEASKIIRGFALP